MMFAFAYTNSQANTVLFTNPQQPLNVSPPPTVNAFYDIDINLSDIKLAPDTIQINFPDNSSTTVAKGDFISRGTNSYKWSGSNNDYDVVLTVHNNQLIAYITSNTKRYGISLLADGVSYRFYDYRLSMFPQNTELETRLTPAFAKPSAVDNT